MLKQVGMWIDHRKAVIVFLMNGEERLKVIESNMEKHIRPSGGSRSKSPYGPQDVMKEDGRERKYRLHLSRWYESVAEMLQDAEELFVFGPGEAKMEFKKHVEETPLAGKITGVETVDKMTDPQVAAKVRKHFLPSESTVSG
ncbi:MAG: hypothetical protein ACP5I4_05360 [Oceanipulchritudo sp.]